ncbi:MAG: immunoglobulin-like domain-containing protein [Bacteroidota bacterium]
MKRRLLLSMIALGAAGLLKAQNPYPIIPIDSVQFVNATKLGLPIPNDTPDYISPIPSNSQYKDTVRFEGIVVTNPKIYGLSSNRKAAFMQRKGGGPWSGVQVMCEPAGTGVTLPVLNAEAKFYENFIVRYKVRVTGVIRTFNGVNQKVGETQVNLIRNNINWENSVEQLSLTPDTLVYSEIQAMDLMKGNPNGTWVQQRLTGEQWEGALVKIKNVTVYSIDNTGGGGTRSFWSVVDDFGNVLDVRDFSAYYRRDDLEDTVPKIVNTFFPPAIGTRLEYIQGIITEYAVGPVTRYGIMPMYPTDLGPCNICPPKILNITQTPNVAQSTDSVEVTAMITSDTTLKEVTLHYNGTGGNIFTLVNMTPTATPNKWLGKIPPFAAGTIVKYYTRALDNRNLRTVIPDTLATNSNYLVTDGGINSIATLQFSASTNGATIWDGDSLTNMDIRGVITGTNFNAGTTRLLTLQSGTGANSAIFIQRPVNNDVTEKWAIGDSVKITSGVVREIFNITTLNEIRGTVVSKNNPLPAFEETLSMDSFALATKIAYNRKWEGVLLKWNNVYVTNINPDAPSDNGEWSVNADSTKTGLRVDDMSISLRNINDTITKGQKLNFIQGPMYFSFGNFKIIPRNLSDMDMCNLDTAKPSLSLNGNNPDTVELGSGPYVDPGAASSDVRDGNIATSVHVTGAVNTNVMGAYVLTYRVADFCGNMADSATRIVVVKDSSNVGINESEFNAANVKLYPNPATTAITVSATFVKTQPVTITLVDLLGKEISTRTVRGAQFNETISIENLNSGIYFCTISNASGSKTLKFVVNGK